MRLIGMLSFYAEDPELLRRTVYKAYVAGVDHLVAVDGPYDLYPTRERYSDDACYHAIFAGADQRDSIDFWNKDGWDSGNEVEKRNFMLGKALEVADPGDWLMVFDADHVWELTSDLTICDALRRAKEFPPSLVSAAEVKFAECAIDDPSPRWYEARLLLRATPGMRYEGAHWRVRFPNGTAVSTLKAGDASIDRQAGVLDLRSVARVRHLVYELPPERRKRQKVYYDGRDAGEGIER